MKYILYIICTVCLVSCESKQIISKSNYEIITEVIYFDNKENSGEEVFYKNVKYNISKKYSSKENFDLIYNGHNFFKASEKERYFIFEVFKSRYLLISYIPSPNNYSSPYDLEREKTYLYDMKSQKIFYFITKNYLLSPIKNINPIKQKKEDNYKLRATINNVFINNDEIVLLLSDLKTLERIKLNALKDNLVKD